MSYQKKRQYDIEEQTLQTLGQKLAGKMPELQDYACNFCAYEVSQINLVIATATDPEFIEKLKNIREKYKIVGRGLYFKRADILTNLSLLVGRTGIRYKHGTRHDNDITKA